MSRVLNLKLVFAALLLAVCSDVGNAQQRPLKEQVIGTWTLVSGSQVGPDAKGMLILDASGHMSMQIIRPGRAKFAANNRMQGTPEENRAAVQGMIAYFGRWSVDESGPTIIYQIESSSYPNSEGTEQRRPLSITADELRNINPAPTGGGVATQIVWQRVN